MKVATYLIRKKCGKEQKKLFQVEICFCQKGQSCIYLQNGQHILVSQKEVKYGI
jgi:hypothetical protein